MTTTTDFRLLSPEFIWLEPEHYQQATIISDRLQDEPSRWQSYLNCLGLLSLAQWLQERNLATRIPTQLIESRLQVGDLTFQAIATENILGEVVSIPAEVIWQPALATHFYVSIEIIEEAEQAIIRGFVNRDRLVNYLQEQNIAPSETGDYQLPLAILETEPQHLVFYCQYLDANTISLPQITAESTTAGNLASNSSFTKLTSWLENIVVEGWQAIETLIDPQANLACSTRSLAQEQRRGKLINLGVELNRVTMILLIAVKEEADSKIALGVQLYPASRQEYLPTEVEITLLSQGGKTLQTVQSRERDNYIQLRPFKGKRGKCFSLEISWAGSKLKENFEL